VSQLLFSLAGGAIADRFDRRRALFVTYAVLAAVEVVLAALSASGALALWNLLPLVVLVGGVGLVGPSLSAMTYDVVGASRLMNANAVSFLNSAIVRTLTGVAAGLALDRLGIAPSYAVVAVLFLLAGAALIPLRVARSARELREPTLRALRAGLRYAASTVAVRSLLVLSAVTEVFGFAYLFVLPVLARDVLGVGATGLGALTSASAAGQFVAMLGLALAGDVRRKGMLLIASAMAFGLSIAALALSPIFAASLAVIFLVGASGSLYDTSMWTVVQMTTSAEMRGRVLGLYIATFGLSQIGGFVVATVATVATLPVALGIAAAIVTVNALRLLPATASYTPAAAAPVEAPPSHV
jgi:MFS family permease